LSEIVKPTVEEIQKKLEDLRKLSRKYRIELMEKRIEDAKNISKEYGAELEVMIERRPLESAGIIFIVGVILGILIGEGAPRRS